jgi:glycosyltransferase involved in cell wall biosynthesis
MKRIAIALHKKNNYAMTHCRSYVSAEVGLLLKKKYGVKFLFDIRGFWVNERVEGGIWNLNNPVFRYAFNKYKKKEADFISGCDALVSLTENGKKEMLTWKSYRNQPLYVIPCSSDFDLFSLTSAEQKKNAREKLNIPADKLVMSYLGSIGTWYLMDEMFDFFVVLKKKYPNAVFLWVTNSNFEIILQKAFEKNVLDLLIIKATREEVPSLIKASDFSISFIKSCYSKKSSSPTKQGELLAMGIPMLCNSGVGDVKEIIENAKGGICIDDFTQQSFDTAITGFEKMFAVSPEEIRKLAFEYYDLKKAQQQYINLYKEILK